jgi:hypothetical protein
MNREIASPDKHIATNAGDAAKYRWIENGHILLWLIKDTCWAMEWKPGGILMILPTVSVAIYLLWRSRGSRADFYHNLAVVMWILANSTWMCGEFFKKELRPVAVGIFMVGVVVLLIYYIFFFKKDRKING